MTRTSQKNQIHLAQRVHFAKGFSAREIPTNLVGLTW